VAAEAITDEHDLLDAARNGGQDASARLVRPCLAQPRGRLPSNAQALFAQDTERWISGPARISTSETTDPVSQRGATK
jgi:hypothetical protein